MKSDAAVSSNVGLTIGEYERGIDEILLPSTNATTRTAMAMITATPIPIATSSVGDSFSCFPFAPDAWSNPAVPVMDVASGTTVTSGVAAVCSVVVTGDNDVVEDRGLLQSTDTVYTSDQVSLSTATRHESISLGQAAVEAEYSPPPKTS